MTRSVIKISRESSERLAFGKNRSMGFQDGTWSVMLMGIFCQPSWLPGLSKSRKPTSKCQHLCHMGAGWNSCVPQVDYNSFLTVRLRVRWTILNAMGFPARLARRLIMTEVIVL